MWLEGLQKGPADQELLGEDVLLELLAIDFVGRFG